MMEDTSAWSSKIGLPPVTQIGVIVRNMEQAVDFYSSAFGVGPFSPISDLVPDKSWYMGEIHPLHLRVSRAKWGALEFELIQPVEGMSIHQDFLDAHGEGVNHLGIETSDYDEIVGTMNRAGFRPLQALEVFLPQYDCWGKATFFDTRSIGGFVIEVMCRPWLASWLAQK
jgi:methylmalonyl-CoA/ethylmalonyl-CoA epimerase